MEAEDPTHEVEGAGSDGTAGRRIGPYRLVREVGRGGMGVVYLAARADDAYQKRVAIKVIHAGDRGPEALRFFRRERQILAGLEHPNIARLLDGGTTEDGAPYLVMEYVEGQPIDRYCDARRLPISQRLQLFRTVCSAVEYAHRNLVVHRDIKPANVLVGADGALRLLDFGIAKLLNADLGSDAPAATIVGAMTPHYASPEQARGEPVTTATDVYSLGVLLYELLTGHLPYRLKTRQPLEVLRAVSEEEPERPSAAVSRTGDPAGAGSPPALLAPEKLAERRESTSRRLRRRLQGDLDHILLRALRKEPERRYPSVEAFSDDVRRHLDGLPVAARKGTWSYRSVKFVRRHVGLVAATTLVVLLLGTAAVTMFVQAARLARERDKARQIASFLTEMFKTSAPNVSRGLNMTAREILDRGAARVARDLGAQPEIRAELSNVIGSVYLELGAYEGAEPLLRQALDLRRSFSADASLEVADSLTSLGHLEYLKGDYANAERLLGEALSVRRRLLPSGHLDVAKSLNNLANVYADQGHLERAEHLYRESLEARIGLLGEGHEDTLQAQVALAAVLHERGDIAGAEALYRAAEPRIRQQFGPDHPFLALTLNNYGNALQDKGDLEGAETRFRETVALDRKLLGSGHPAVATDLDNLGQLLSARGLYAEAEAVFREALSIHEKALGAEGHPETVKNLSGLAHSLRRQHRLPDAERHARRAVDLGRRLLPEGHLTTASALDVLGRVLVDENRAGEAEPLLRQGLAWQRKGARPGSPGASAAERDLGACLAALGRYQEAEALLLSSYRALSSSPGVQEETREALQDLVALYRRWNKPREAAAYAARLAAAGP